jgi:hypothetical protein
MSLGRFLAAGRSLIGMKDIDSRYQMRSANLLPKFGSAKNPFVTVPKTESVKAELPESQKSVPAVSRVASVVRSTAPLTEREPKEERPAATVPEVTSEAVSLEKSELKNSEIAPATPISASSREPLPIGKWLKKLNPLAYLPLPLRMPGRKSVKPSYSHIQTELSLEKVRVVRNDLSETDLEVVRVRAKAVDVFKAPAAQVQPVAMKSGPTTWGRLTSRIFGPQETQIR